MPDYKKLYFELFNEISDLIKYLQEMQIAFEEKFICDENNEITD